MSGLSVVFGVRGAIGMAIVRRLHESGVRVRAVSARDEERGVALPAHVETMRADAFFRREAVAAAEGAEVIYHCLDFRFRHWHELWQTVTSNIIAAAQATGASLVAVGSTFAYGPLQQQPAREDHPLAASGERGRLRAAAQEALVRASEAGEVRVLIPRFPPVYGPFVLNRFYGQVFVHAIRNEATDWFGRFDTPRNLIYIEDVARASILLAGRPEAFGQVWHVPGPEPLTAAEFIRMVYTAAGHRPRVHRISRLALDLEAMFDPEMDGFREFDYLFKEPHLLDGSKLASAFPDFEYTPHAEAVPATVAWFRQHYGTASTALDAAIGEG